MPNKKNTVEKFWDLSDKSNGQDSCWVWSRVKDKDGYGMFRFNNKNYRAHRLAFLLTYKSLPECVCHHCDNPSCINPKHLFGGTTKDNIADRVRKKRDNPLKGINHPYHKITEDDVLWIRRNYKKIRSSDMAKKLGIDQGNLWQIANRRTWKHLP